MTLKDLKDMRDMGIALDLTDISVRLSTLTVVSKVRRGNMYVGALLQDTITKQLYVIIGRCSTLFMYI